MINKFKSADNKMRLLGTTEKDDFRQANRMAADLALRQNSKNTRKHKRGNSVNNIEKFLGTSIVVDN